MTTLEEAIAGDKRAIEKNFVQMIGGLNGVDTDAVAVTGFVQPWVLDELARAVLGRKLANRLTIEVCGVKCSASVDRTTAHELERKATTIQPSIGSNIVMTQHRDEVHRGRTVVYFQRGGKGNDPRIGTYFHVSLPTKALRAWAEGRLDR